MEFLNYFLPVIIPVFVMMCGAYFILDILYLARKNDRLCAENAKLKKRLREIEK